MVPYVIRHPTRIAVKAMRKCRARDIFDVYCNGLVPHMSTTQKFYLEFASDADRCARAAERMGHFDIALSYRRMEGLCLELAAAEERLLGEDETTLSEY